MINELQSDLFWMLCQVFKSLAMLARTQTAVKGLVMKYDFAKQHSSNKRSTNKAMITEHKYNRCYANSFIVVETCANVRLSRC